MGRWALVIDDNAIAAFHQLQCSHQIHDSRPYHHHVAPPWQHRRCRWCGIRCQCPCVLPLRKHEGISLGVHPTRSTRVHRVGQDSRGRVSEKFLSRLIENDHNASISLRNRPSEAMYILTTYDQDLRPRRGDGAFPTSVVLVRQIGTVDHIVFQQIAFILCRQSKCHENPAHVPCIRSVKRIVEIYPVKQACRSGIAAFPTAFHSILACIAAHHGPPCRFPSLHR